MTIGILGGGQLGYMLALAGYPLGLHFRFLDPSPEAPVGRIATRITAEFTNRGALKKFRDRFDPRRYNGAMFLGLRGIAVKSHGSTDAFGFANAIGVAIDMKVNGFLEKIRADLARVNSAMPTPEPAAL